MASETADFNLIVARLIRKAKVQASENLIAGDYEDLVSEALTLHNSNYQLTATTSTVPLVEAYPLLLLAWANLTLVRASQYASSPNSSGSSGFGTDRNTPYYKLMDLSKSLQQQYSSYCQTLGLTTYAIGPNGKGPIVSTQILAQNYSNRAQTPLDMARNVYVPLLNTPSRIESDGTVVLTFRVGFSPDFYKYEVFYMTGAGPLFVEWNVAGTVAPKINDAAQSIGSNSLKIQDVTSLKLTGLATTSGLVHRFLLTTVNSSRNRAYSSEVVVTQP